MGIRDKVNHGVVFLNRIKNSFNWDEDEEEMTNDDDTREQEMTPYMDILAEMLGVEQEHELTNPIEVSGYDANEEAIGAQENCDLNIIESHGGQVTEMESSNTMPEESMDEVMNESADKEVQFVKNNNMEVFDVVDVKQEEGDESHGEDNQVSKDDQDQGGQIAGVHQSNRMKVRNPQY